MFMKSTTGVNVTKILFFVTLLLTDANKLECLYLQAFKAWPGACPRGLRQCVNNIPDLSGENGLTYLAFFLIKKQKFYER
jgi:hypothetical protein